METAYDSTTISLYSTFINCIDLNHPSAAEKSAYFFQQTLGAGADRSTLSGVEVNLPSNE